MNPDHHSQQLVIHALTQQLEALRKRASDYELNGQRTMHLQQQLNVLKQSACKDNESFRQRIQLLRNQLSTLNLQRQTLKLQSRTIKLKESDLFAELQSLNSIVRDRSNELLLLNSALDGLNSDHYQLEQETQALHKTHSERVQLKDQAYCKLNQADQRKSSLDCLINKAQSQSQQQETALKNLLETALMMSNQLKGLQQTVKLQGLSKIQLDSILGCQQNQLKELVRQQNKLLSQVQKSSFKGHHFMNLIQMESLKRQEVTAQCSSLENSIHNYLQEMQLITATVELARQQSSALLQQNTVLTQRVAILIEQGRRLDKIRVEMLEGLRVVEQENRGLRQLLGRQEGNQSRLGALSASSVNMLRS